MVDTRTKELMSISSGLFAKRRKVDERNQHIAENIYPMRADWTQELDDGDEVASFIYDSYPIIARETLGNGIDSMLRQGDWFEVGTGNKERDEKIANAGALKWATNAMRMILKDPRSGWQNATKEGDMDWAAFGNPVFSVEETATRDFVSVRSWHPKTCAWMANENRVIDVNHRKFKMAARNIKRMHESGRWKGDIHHNIELACKLDPSKEFECLHILMPVEEMYADDGARLRQIRHKNISIYLDLENESYLNELGSPVFNYVIPRWRRLGNNPHGWSPAALNSIGDDRVLQAIARTVMEQAEKAVDPPTIGDGSVFSRDINLFAGGHTAVDLPEDRRLQDVFSTVETSAGVRIGVDVKQDVRFMIAESFLLNKLFLPDLRQMTALETSVRTEEFRRAALPFFTPIETEYHSPLLSVVFELAVNMGIIPAEIFPEELSGEDVAFTFNSPLNEAEGRKTVDAFFANMQIIAAGAQVDQTIGSIFDVRKATADAARAVPGAQPDWQLDEDVIKRKDAEAEQVKKLAQGADIARQGAGVVADASNAAMAARNAGLLPA